MTINQGSDKKNRIYYNDALQNGVHILAIDIFKSTNEFFIEGNGLRTPLTLVGGMGYETIKKVLLDRQINGDYQNLIFCFARLRKAGVSEELFKKLVKINALTNFNVNRATILNEDNFSKIKTTYKAIAKHMELNKVNDGVVNMTKEVLDNFEIIEEFNNSEFYAFEIVIGGLATLRENVSNIRANVMNIADQASRAIGRSD
jgi:DNA polymerase-3 subunit alpha